jgi:putative AlgH/UPF0301 family transcriptional regulator
MMQKTRSTIQSIQKVENKFMGVRRVTLAVAGLLALAALCPAQSVQPEDLAQGKILIMQRDAPDPLFARSVILLARYDKTGALGLMIHHPSPVTIQRGLKGMKGAENRTDALFVGGPVGLEGVMALLRSESPPEGAKQVAGKLYLLASKQSLGTALAEGRKASELRIFSATLAGGRASWSARCRSAAGTYSTTTSGSCSTNIRRRCGSG